jgi:hypothetical protein
MGIVEKLNQLDRRWIFLLLFILSFAPVLSPLGLPVPIQDATRGSYNALDTLQAGDLICVTFDYAGGSAAELYPQNVAILRHALQKDLRVLTVAFAIGGDEMADRALREAGYFDNKEYGTDFVNLGYIAGFETAMSAFASNPKGTRKTDYYGTQIGQLPIMDEITSLEDFKYLAFTTSTSQDHYIRQFSGYTTKIVGCIQSLYFSVMKVYLGARQIEGFINGLRGSAEYELLINRPGVGVITMDQVSVTHLFAIILLVIGNIAFYLTRTRGE